MTRSPQPNQAWNVVTPSDDDTALLAPWSATGTLSPRDARQVAAAVVSDKNLAAAIRAAQAEQAAAVALGEALGAPSVRPMLALFAAIDAEMAPYQASNVMPFTRRSAAVALSSRDGGLSKSWRAALNVRRSSRD